MKKGTILLTGLLFLNGMVQAQGTIVRIEKDNAREIKGELVKGKRIPASGTTYLFEDWKMGRLVFSDGTSMEMSELKYDLFTQDLYYQQGGNLFLVNRPVKEFHIHANDTIRIFRNGYPGQGKLPQQQYYEVLYDDGQWQLLKLTRKTVEEQDQFQVGTQLVYVDLERFYLYGKAASRWIPVSRDSHSFQPFYAGKEKQVQGYTNEKGRKFSNEREMVAFMQLVHDLK